MGGFFMRKPPGGAGGPGQPRPPQQGSGAGGPWVPAVPYKNSGDPYPVGGGGGPTPVNIESGLPPAPLPPTAGLSSPGARFPGPSGPPVGSLPGGATSMKPGGPAPMPMPVAGEEPMQTPPQPGVGMPPEPKPAPIPLPVAQAPPPPPPVVGPPSPAQTGRRRALQRMY